MLVILFPNPVKYKSCLALSVSTINILFLLNLILENILLIVEIAPYKINLSFFKNFFYPKIHIIF